MVQAAAFDIDLDNADTGLCAAGGQASRSGPVVFTWNKQFLFERASFACQAEGHDAMLATAWPWFDSGAAESVTVLDIRPAQLLAQRHSIRRCQRTRSSRRRGRWATLIFGVCLS